MGLIIEKNSACDRRTLPHPLSTVPKYRLELDEVVMVLF